MDRRSNIPWPMEFPVFGSVTMGGALQVVIPLYATARFYQQIEKPLPSVVYHAHARSPARAKFVPTHRCGRVCQIV
jgi:hypothetical protein